MGRTLHRTPVLTLLALGPALLPSAAGAAAGDLDCTFGSGGIVDVDVGAPDAAFAAALQSSGAIVTVGSGSGTVRLGRFLPNGTLDTTFAGGGTVTHAFPGLGVAGAVAIDSQDRIVVAGRIMVSSDPEAFVARFTAAGAVDTTFGGGDGWTSFDFLPATASAGQEQTSTVVVDASDRPVVGGWTDPNGATLNPSNRNLAIARLTTAGVLDSTFGGGDGIVLASSPGTSNDDDLRALKMDPSGRLVGIGATTSPGTNFGPRNTILARWTAAGALDTTFDGDGVLVLDMSEAGSDDFGHDLDFDSSGNILALGQGTDDPLLGRLDSSGALDTTFAGDGIVQQSFLGAQDVVEHVLVQSDDKVLVTGWPPGSSSFDFASMRFTTAGALDSTWGSTGVVVTNIDFSDRAHAAVLQPNQRLILAGGVRAEARLGMARYLNDDSVSATSTTITGDSPDPSFVGQAVPVDVTVEATSGSLAPTGTVQIGDGAVSCSATLAAGAGTSSTGTCNLTFPTTGARTVTAAFQGTSTFCPSSDTESHTVERATTTTSITGDTPDPSVVGQAVQVSYSVTSAFAGTPTGTVTVTDGVASCTGTVAAGSCALALSTVGVRTLEATYAGDGSFLGSTSAGEPHTVDPAATTTSLFSITPNPVELTNDVTVAFQVDVVPPGAGSPSGTVTISAGGVGSCSAPVAAGSCTFTPAVSGTYPVTASYPGDGSFSPSEATASQDLDVEPQPAVTEIPTAGTLGLAMLALLLGVAAVGFLRG